MFHSERGAVFLLINHSLIPTFVDAKLMLIKKCIDLYQLADCIDRVRILQHS